MGVHPHPLWSTTPHVPQVQNHFVSCLVLLFFLMCFSNSTRKQMEYHWHCASQLCPKATWTKGLFANYDKAGPRPLLPSVLDRTDQYSFTDCTSEVNNQTDQGLMPSAGFLLSHVCFWKSLFQLHPFPMCMLVATLFPFSSSCMLLCGISSGCWTPCRCSSMICQGILSTGVWIPQVQLSDLI